MKVQPIDNEWALTYGLKLINDGIAFEEALYLLEYEWVVTSITSKQSSASCRYFLAHRSNMERLYYSTWDKEVCDHTLSLDYTKPQPPDEAVQFFKSFVALLL